MGNPSQFDYLIVGAGLSGAVVAERIASQLDKQVLVIDKRPHVGGNTFDCIDEHGVLIHKYGPHLFHTNSKTVWDYLSRFTDWTQYEHRILGEIGNQRLPIPFNWSTLEATFPERQANRIKSLLLSMFGDEAHVPILKLMELADSPEDSLSHLQKTDLREVSTFIYENIFEGYTIKQWGLTPEQLGPSVMSRVPVRLSYDDRYFRDQYQALPSSGYTRMVESILDHPNIRVELNCPFDHHQPPANFDRLIYTGATDAFFDYRHGSLPYRSLRFEFVHHDVDFLLEATSINFPNEHDYTRITEFKRATGQKTEGTTVAIEYPQAHVRGENEAYYPVPTDENRELFQKYRVDIENLDSVTFLGRLADYQYYNMDQAVARALTIFSKQIAR